MKKRIVFFMVICLSLLPTAIYAQGQQQVCNTSVEDTWIKENKEKIKTMTRKDWLALKENENIKKAVFSAFSPEQKQKFWEDKTLEVINQFEWNDKEKAHLNSLLERIRNGNAFSEDINNEEFLEFTIKWSEYATNELKWSRRLVYAIAGDGNRLKNKEGELILNK